jgi:hypothetical protein
VRRLLSLSAVAIGLTLGLSACSQQSGLDLARQACVHVNRSLHDYALSSRPDTTAALAADLRDRADSELRIALPLAAQANSADGSWNSLMTTISEEATVDESHLVPALKAQCVQADTNLNVNPQNVNPQNGNPHTPTTQTPNTANVNPQGASGT